MAAKLVISPNGPIRIEGDFEIVDSKGTKFDLGGRTAVGLCRCGASQKKPFCDGSHKGCEFTDEGIAFNLPPRT
jgi:CDGSH-type Zn-finger protein